MKLTKPHLPEIHDIAAEKNDRKFENCNVVLLCEQAEQVKGPHYTQRHHTAPRETICPKSLIVDVEGNFIETAYLDRMWLMTWNVVKQSINIISICC